jgi:hypothetical protein
MQQFGPRAEGSLVESPIELAMERLRREIPEMDEAAAEAHIVLSRAYAVYFAALASRYETLGLSASATAVERMNRPFISRALSLVGRQGTGTAALAWNAGMTSLANHSNCSRITLCGAPTGWLTVTRRRPG